jgi:hypothetical protein
MIKILVHDLDKEGHTFVYWKVSCLPVNVASMDWGVVSIWHMPGAEHKALQECSCLEAEMNEGPERKMADTPAKVTLVRCQSM